MAAYRVIDPPAFEPVTVDEARRHIRAIDDVTEDEYIETLISAARETCENITRSAIPLRTITVTYDTGGTYELPVLPVVRVVSCTAEYTLTGGVIKLDGAATVEYEAGYEAVPKSIIQAILLLVAYWYDNREAASTENLKTTPWAVDSLLRPYRMRWL